MAAGDVTIIRDIELGRSGSRLIVGTVTLDGGNPTPVQLSGYLSSLDMGVVSFNSTAAPDADPNSVTCAVSGGTVLDVYAWKVTTGGAAGNPTEIASTNNTVLVAFMAIGAGKPPKVT